MGLNDLFFPNNRGNEKQSSVFDTSSMSRRELDRCFTPKVWGELTYSERCKCIRALEERFAAEQGRPAKHVVFLPMEGGTCGYWSKERGVIAINDTLVSDGSFIYKGRLLGERSDAPMKIYETVAHEGYHAYQTYALNNPHVHEDKAQLEQWRINDLDSPLGRDEHNYFIFDHDADKYRIQPLERDAFEYGFSRTKAAFEALQKEIGDIPEYQDYLDICEFNSYDNALNNAMQKDPEVLKHMEKEMYDREKAWSKGISCGRIGMDPKYINTMEKTGLSIEAQQATAVQEAAPIVHTLYQPVSRYEEYKAMEDPYAEDVGYTVLAKGYSGSTKYVPSKMESYLQSVSALHGAYPDRFQDPENYRQYMDEIYRIQDKLEYYPELDLRMAEYYSQQYSKNMELYASASEAKGRTLSLEEYKQTEAQMRWVSADNLGYYAYGPGYEQQMAQIEGLNADIEPAAHEEGEGLDMESLYGREEEAAPKVYEAGEGVDMESLYGREEEVASEAYEAGEGVDMESLYGGEEEAAPEAYETGGCVDMETLYGAKSSNTPEQDSSMSASMDNGADESRTI